ncbi:MAG TPA: glycerate kinase [Anaerolineae bacterium]|nr:glycerate kinase [Anaerolineae bacterium]HMR66964.1 glycerate kinase [Anaerolineae bacterium]
MTTLKEDAVKIITQAIDAVLPEAAVQKQLRALDLPASLTVVAIGKAAWRMAHAAKAELGDRLRQGVVITKYEHALGDIPGLEIYEAGHPLLDQNSIAATQRALELVDPLTEKETVLFLVSGGGSALFEAPVTGLTLEDLIELNRQLLKSGANIVEINTLRKHLSTVKGGRFAQRVAPARIISLVLSDVLGDRLDSIASGPAYPDASTSAEALAIVAKYGLDLPPPMLAALHTETPKTVDNAETYIIGSVRVVAEAAATLASSLGYTPLILTTTLDCEAREAGRFLAAIAREVLASGQPVAPPCALILGGETVVNVKGNGLGGRNQELALAAALEIAGQDRIVIGSAGTDGTDGPTDAAGGVVDGGTVERLRAQGLDPYQALNNNDAYPALMASGDLLKTGPTGTNVNDISIILVN